MADIELTSGSGNVTVPEGVTKYSIICVAKGGNGGSGYDDGDDGSLSASGGGGGGGGTWYANDLSCTPDNDLAYDLSGSSVFWDGSNRCANGGNGGNAVSETGGTEGAGGTGNSYGGGAGGIGYFGDGNASIGGGGGGSGGTNGSGNAGIAGDGGGMGGTGGASGTGPYSGDGGDGGSVSVGQTGSNYGGGGGGGAPGYSGGAGGIAMIAITWGPAEQPYAPSNLTVVDITEIDFGLTWTDNSNLETQLILQVQRYEDDYVANEWDYTIAANEVSLSNINVYNGQTNPLFIQANTHYKARLAAVNGPAGDVFSDWVEVDFWTSSGDQSKGFFRLLG